jgi:hypothetical protein
MDGFFSRFAWAWLEGQSSEFPKMPLIETDTAARLPAKKTWSKHAAHRRTLTPHQVSSGGLDEEISPSTGP